jgi:hypothetical protein
VGQETAKRTIFAAKTGLRKGIKTGLTLLGLVLPVYIAVVFLKYTPLMPFLERALKPAMSLFHLPAEAALPLVVGAFSDEYAVVGALGGFDFGKATVTTVAMMVLCFHAIPMETVLARKMGFAAMKVALYRFVLAVVTGIAVGFIGGALS